MKTNGGGGVEVVEGKRFRLIVLGERLKKKMTSSHFNTGRC